MVGLPPTPPPTEEDEDIDASGIHEALHALSNASHKAITHVHEKLALRRLAAEKLRLTRSTLKNFTQDRKYMKEGIKEMDLGAQKLLNGSRLEFLPPTTTTTTLPPVFLLNCTDYGNCTKNCTDYGNCSHPISTPNGTKIVTNDVLLTTNATTVPPTPPGTGDEREVARSGEKPTITKTITAFPTEPPGPCDSVAPEFMGGPTVWPTFPQSLLNKNDVFMCGKSRPIPTFLRVVGYRHDFPTFMSSCMGMCPPETGKVMECYKHGKRQGKSWSAISTVGFARQRQGKSWSAISTVGVVGYSYGRVRRGPTAL